MSKYNNEHQALIEDIYYLENLISVEKEQIKQRLIGRLSNSQSVEEKADVMGDEIAHILSTMSARIQVIEKVLSVENQTNEAISKVENILGQTNKEVTPVLLDSILLSIVDIGTRNHLWNLQHSLDNKPYYSLPAGSEVNFVLPINRKNKQTLAVDVIDFSSQNMLKTISFFIDGHKLKHKIKTVNGIIRLVCYLPESKNNDTTYVSLQLPKQTKGNNFMFYMSDVNCVPKPKIAHVISQLMPK